MRGILKYISIILLISVLGGALFLFWAAEKFNEPHIRASEESLIVPQGQGLIRTAWQLEKRALISNAQIFRYGVKFLGFETKIRAGEYLIPKQASMSDILAIFVEGKVIQHKVTIIEGWTSWQIADHLNKVKNLTGTITVLPEEGTLLPNTYLYTTGDNVRDITRRMRIKMDVLLDELWLNKADNLPLKSKEEALILASIVEKETGISGERRHVASVFINRLRLKMKLQSDPTIIYGLTNKGALGHPILRSELNKKTAYNTYFIKALPPTAISHPSEKALRAVLNPLTTKDLYFVADGTGGHIFAPNLKDHLRNVKKWRKIERQR